MNPLIEKGLKAETRAETLRIFKLVIKCLYYQIKFSEISDAL